VRVVEGVAAVIAGVSGSSLPFSVWRSEAVLWRRACRCGAEDSLSASSVAASQSGMHASSAEGKGWAVMCSCLTAVPYLGTKFNLTANSPRSHAGAPGAAANRALPSGPPRARSSTPSQEHAPQTRSDQRLCAR
jgi:hypothetical protein